MQPFSGAHSTTPRSRGFFRRDYLELLIWVPAARWQYTTETGCAKSSLVAEPPPARSRRSAWSRRHRQFLAPADPARPSSAVSALELLALVAPPQTYRALGHPQPLGDRAQRISLPAQQHYPRAQAQRLRRRCDRNHDASQFSQGTDANRPIRKSRKSVTRAGSCCLLAHTTLRGNSRQV
jgi:hypothetical protein